VPVRPGRRLASRRGDCERRPCQCERPHLHAGHGAPGLGSTLLPQALSHARHIVSAPAVTRPSASGRGPRRYGSCLQSVTGEDSGARGRGGWSEGTAHSSVRDAPLPFVTFSGLLCVKGVCNGRIRLGFV
jgi:hypothetical protein